MEENKEQTKPNMYTIQFDELKYIKYMKMMIMNEILTKTSKMNYELRNNIEKINDISRLNILYEIIVNGGVINVDSLDREDIRIVALYYVAVCDIDNVIKYYEKLIDEDDKHLVNLFRFLVEMELYDNVKKYAPMMLKRNLNVGSDVLIKLQKLYNPHEREEINRLLISRMNGAYCGSTYCEMLGKKCIVKMIRYFLITNNDPPDFFSKIFLKYDDHRRSHECGKLTDILDDMFDDTMMNMISQLSHDEVKTKCKIIQIIHRLIHNQFDIMKLHFNYTIKGKGYDDAKSDFLSHIVAKSHTDETHTNDSHNNDSHDNDSHNNDSHNDKNNKN